MLPPGTKSHWWERETRRVREGSHRHKAVEDPGFPGVSLSKKVFSVPKAGRKPRAGPSTRNTGFNEASQTFKLTTKPRRNANERPSAGKGHGKQEGKCHDSQMIDPTNITKPTAALPDASGPTALRRGSAPANLANIQLTSSISQPTTSDTRDTGLRVAAVNVGSVREFEEFVRHHNSSVMAANSVTEELVGEFEKLGIKEDLPEWKTGEKK